MNLVAVHDSFAAAGDLDARIRRFDDFIRSNLKTLRPVGANPVPRVLDPEALDRDIIMLDQESIFAPRHDGHLRVGEEGHTFVRCLHGFVVGPGAYPDSIAAASTIGAQRLPDRFPGTCRVHRLEDMSLVVAGCGIDEKATHEIRRSIAWNGDRRTARGVRVVAKVRDGLIDYAIDARGSRDIGLAGGAGAGIDGGALRGIAGGQLLQAEISSVAIPEEWVLGEVGPPHGLRIRGRIVPSGVREHQIMVEKKR